MSTRSYIAKKQPDETFKAVYCHFDGYPEGVGQTLVDSFTDENKVDKLLKLGSLSYLRDDIETQNNFKTFPIRGNEIELKDVTMAYHRDRGDDLEINEFSNLEPMLDYFDKSWGDYLYLFENVWLVKNDDNDFFMEVKEVLNENS
jgi:hypothetical protein